MSYMQRCSLAGSTESRGRTVFRSRRLRELHKVHCCRVHAVAQAGWPRAVIEHMAEVRVAAAAGDGGAVHSHAGIVSFDNVLARDGLPEAGPAGAGLELGGRVEYRRVAADAVVNALVVE